LVCGTAVLSWNGLAAGFFPVGTPVPRAGAVGVWDSCPQLEWGWQRGSSRWGHRSHRWVQLVCGTAVLSWNGLAAGFFPVGTPVPQVGVVGVWDSCPQLEWVGSGVLPGGDTGPTGGFARDQSIATGLGWKQIAQ